MELAKEQRRCSEDWIVVTSALYKRQTLAADVPIMDPMEEETSVLSPPPSMLRNRLFLHVRSQRQNAFLSFRVMDSMQA